MPPFRLPLPTIGPHLTVRLAGCGAAGAAAGDVLTAGAVTGGAVIVGVVSGGDSTAGEAGAVLMVGIVSATVALLPLSSRPEAIRMITRTTPDSSAPTENQRAKPARRGGRRLDSVAAAFAAAAVFPVPFDSAVASGLLADFGAVFRAALGADL